MARYAQRTEATDIVPADRFEIARITLQVAIEFSAIEFERLHSFHDL